MPAPARQKRRRHDPASGLCAGAGPRSARGDRLLFGSAGVEIQPPCPAYHRVARIRRVLPRYDHQAGFQAAQLYPHCRRGRDHRLPGRPAFGGPRRFAHGQPRRLFYPRRPLQGRPRSQFSAHPRQLLGVVYVGGPHPHAQRFARADRLHPLARRGPDRHAHGPRTGRGAEGVGAARRPAGRYVAASELRSAQILAPDRNRPAHAGRGVVGAAAGPRPARSQAAARSAAVRKHVSGGIPPRARDFCTD